MTILEVKITDPRYSFILKGINNPPQVLYCRGNVDLLNKKGVAIVGTRQASQKGLAIAERLAIAFGGMGYTIISGLAKGIDTAAHVGALKSGAPTIAVLATGVDPESIYPQENKELAEEIVKNGGLLISEHSPGTGVQKENFPKRNRIQSGLSMGVIPVQTGVNGGTQHTIRFAQEQKRLLVVPDPAILDGKIDINEGIYSLVEKGVCEVISGKSDFARIDGLLKSRRNELIQLSLSKMGLGSL